MSAASLEIPQPLRTRSLAWWRGSPVGPGMEVRDAHGVYVGFVISVSLGVDGEVEALDVETPPAVTGRRGRKRLSAERIAVRGASVRVNLCRREIVGLPDARI